MNEKKSDRKPESQIQHFIFRCSMLHDGMGNTTHFQILPLAVSITKSPLDGWLNVS